MFKTTIILRFYKELQYKILKGISIKDMNQPHGDLISIVNGLSMLHTEMKNRDYPDGILFVY